MASNIDATKPLDGSPAVKADLRANLAAAKSEIEALQVAQSAQSSLGGGVRNRVLNPGFRIDRRALGTVAITGGNKSFVMDKWQIGTEVAGGAALSAITTAGPFNKSAIQVTVTTPKGSLATTDRHWIAQTIESTTMIDLSWGYSAAAPLMLSFYIKTTVAGTFAVALQNTAFNRSRVQTFSVPQANVWTYITVAFPADTGVVWATTNTTFWTLRFDLGHGTTYQGGNTVYISGDIRSTATATAIVNTASATYSLADVQLEVGTAASTFERRPDTFEQMLTARYYETGQLNIASYGVAGGTVFQFIPFQVNKRVPSATITRSGETTSNLNTLATASAASGFLPSAIITATGSSAWSAQWAADADQAL